MSRYFSAPGRTAEVFRIGPLVGIKVDGLVVTQDPELIELLLKPHEMPESLMPAMHGQEIPETDLSNVVQLFPDKGPCAKTG